MPVDVLERPTTTAASGKMTITCTNWRPLERNTLRGFADLLVKELLPRAQKR